MKTKSKNRHYIEKYGITVSECTAIHQWLRAKYGKANKCVMKDCNGKSKKYDWALINGKKYERNKDNFLFLCRSCHTFYDVVGRRSYATENNPRVKLNWKIVNSIRKEYKKRVVTHKILGEKYNVSANLIRLIIIKELWKQ